VELTSDSSGLRVRPSPSILPFSASFRARVVPAGERGDTQSCLA
jgi:hypothetical protein